jgi:hypothetical protein
MGRTLRALLHAAGFRDVEAAARFLSYGTPERVRSFGRARAADTADPWFATKAHEHGLLDEPERRAVEAAWLTWSESPDAFVAFPWCRAVGWR